MRARDEVEAAYFALLRARDEVADLQRYEQYLESESRRLHRFVTEGAALDDDVPRRLRRRLAHTDQPVTDALRARQEVLREELRRLPQRVAAAEAFVTECEHEHARLRAG